MGSSKTAVGKRSAWRFLGEKITNNRRRDDEVNKQLLFMGWTVIRFWGKEIMKNTDECVRVIEETVFDIKMEVND